MNVLLVNMPFSMVWPAIGVSLLRAHLEQMGVRARVQYFNLRFAEMLGLQSYSLIAGQAFCQALAGEVAFADCLFGDRLARFEEYLEITARRFSEATPVRPQRATPDPPAAHGTRGCAGPGS